MTSSATNRLQELRNEAIACMALADLRPQRRLDDVFIENHGTGFQKAVAFAPSWDVYARAEVGGPISVRNLADDREIAACRAPVPPPTSWPSVRTAVIWSPSIIACKGPSNTSFGTGSTRRKVGGQPCQVSSSPIGRFHLYPGRPARAARLPQRRFPGLLRVGHGESGLLRGNGRSSTVDLAHNTGSGRLATVNNGGMEVTFRDAKTGAPVAAPWKLPSNVWSLAWDHGSNLARRRLRRPPHLSLGPTAGKPRGVLEGHEGAVVKVAFNPAGTLLASWGWDNTTRLWDPASGKELLSIPGDFLEFSPDGRRLAYVKGKELGIWEVADGGVCRLLAHPADVIHAAVPRG